MSSPFRGEVVSLAADKVGVKLASADKSKAPVVNFTVPATAKIVRDGKTCSVKDIQKGDSVVVTFASKPGCGPAITQLQLSKSSSQ